MSCGDCDYTSTRSISIAMRAEDLGEEALAACEALLAKMEEAKDLSPEGKCNHFVVQIDADWGCCIKCGDNTFPMSDSAAGMRHFMKEWP